LIEVVEPVSGSSGRCQRCGWACVVVGAGMTLARETVSSAHEPVTKSQEPFREGEIFAGRYRIERLLGAGGMGAVYRAFDLKLQRRLALKVPHFDPHSHPDLLKRFQREARIAASFNHPNLCPIFDFDQWNHLYYLTMPFIEGRPLAALLEAGRLPQRQAAIITRTVALALAEAHRLGVVHRDLKPANIMVSPQGKLIVMDFGIARSLTAADSLQTRTGAVLGTPAYMAPEQVQGIVSAIGAATDIYSLGVIFYQLLTGRQPFLGNPSWVCVQIVHDEPAPPSATLPELDRGLEAVCLRAMRKDSRDRFASMEEMAAAIEAALGAPGQSGWAVELSISEPPKKPWRWVPQRRLMAALLLAMAGGMVLAWSRLSSSPPADTRSQPGIGIAMPPKPGPAAPNGLSPREVKVVAASARRGLPSDLPEPTPPEPEPALAENDAGPAAPSPAESGDSSARLARLRTQLKETYRGADPDHPDAKTVQLWDEIHALQEELADPAMTIVVKVRKSRMNVPLVIYCNDRNERRRELRLNPGTVEVLSLVMPVTLTYVLHASHPGGGGARGASLPEPYAARPPHLAGGPPPPFAPPPHLAPGLPVPEAPLPVAARRLEFKNREVVVEFEYNQACGRWKHYLHPASSAAGRAASVAG
jgi:serine/threonine protein kinase